jgi:hypothetical protein
MGIRDGPSTCKIDQRPSASQSDVVAPASFPLSFSSLHVSFSSPPHQFQLFSHTSSTCSRQYLSVYRKRGAECKICCTTEKPENVKSTCMDSVKSAFCFSEIDINPWPSVEDACYTAPPCTENENDSQINAILNDQKISDSRKIAMKARKKQAVAILCRGWQGYRLFWA